MTATETDLDLTEPVLICLLGSFRVMKAGAYLPMPSGGKTAILLSSLALRDRYRASRESLLEALWPGIEAARSAHSLNSLIHALRQMLGDVLAGASPVIYSAGGYELNVSAGVGVDVSHFEAHAGMAERQLRAGNSDAAVRSWLRAVALYHGEICAADDMRAIVQRERVRALYLSLLSRLADQYFRERDYRSALDYALRLLSHDPCREDAHRVVMRCHVRIGERAQALRQYRVCQQILAAEFEARPEPLTDALFDRLRLDPAGV
ncbi:MAG: transcriptional regulator, family [Frankiales bacterium]|nr:transcriptional regulator, family [Frankiales bacterium]